MRYDPWEGKMPINAITTFLKAQLQCSLVLQDSHTPFNATIYIFERVAGSSIRQDARIRFICAFTSAAFVAH